MKANNHTTQRTQTAKTYTTTYIQHCHHSTKTTQEIPYLTHVRYEEHHTFNNHYHTKPELRTTRRNNLTQLKKHRNTNLKIDIKMNYHRQQALQITMTQTSPKSHYTTGRSLNQTLPRTQ